MKPYLLTILFSIVLLSRSELAFTAPWSLDKHLSSPYVSWGISKEKDISHIELSDAWKNFVAKKKDVVVAVIDTGADHKHVFLKNNIYVVDAKVTDTNFGVDFSKSAKNPQRPMDDHGHGTHVAGVIKSVYPDVKLLILKYYDPQASGQENLKATIAALKYAVDAKVDIINYSGGGPEASSEELQVLREAQEKDILIVAAAGNERSDIDNGKNSYYPASYGLSNIITVAGHDKKAVILPSSNYGKKSVDLMAPGLEIRSAYPGGSNRRAAPLTGTSQATAFVTGVAALMKAENPSLTSAALKDLIREAVTYEQGLENRCIAKGRLNASRSIEKTEEFSLGKKTAAKQKIRSDSKDSSERIPANTQKRIYLKLKK